MIEHRVAAVDDVEDGLVRDLRADVVAGAGQFGERGEDVDFGQRVGGGLQTAGGFGDQLAELGEDLQFDRQRALFGGENFFFVLFQFRRDVALGVL